MSDNMWVLAFYIIICLLMINMFGSVKGYFIFITFLGLSIFGMKYYGEMHEEKRKEYIYVKNNIEIKGYNTQGHVKNIGNKPIKIKCVWVFRGESTQYIKIFKPNESKKQYISNQHAFYVLDIENGNELNIIRISEQLYSK